MVEDVQLADAENRGQKRRWTALFRHTLLLFSSARLPQAEVLADIELQGALTWSRGGHKVNEAERASRARPGAHIVRLYV